MKADMRTMTVLLGVLLVCSILPASCLNPNPLLLLISFDGFRHDLLNATTTPHIWQFAQQGVWFSKGVRSQYLTYTAPNHASMATGLLEENHGIVGNHFYDPVSKEYYDLFNSTGAEGAVNKSLEEHFYSGEPIWLTNERAQEARRSASLSWPAGDAHWPSPPHTPSVVKTWKGYKNTTHWMADFDTITDLLTREKDPLNFVAWYLAEPDHILHAKGFYTGDLTKTLTGLDLAFDYVMKRIAANEELANRLNIILTADHGHAEIEGLRNVFCVSNFVNLSETVRIGDGMVYVEDASQVQNIYEALKKAIKDGNFGVNIYLKKDFPERFGYKHTPRVGDIIIEPHIGYVVHPYCPPELAIGIANNVTKLNMSTHGMSPDESAMRAFLIMKGPAFNDHLKVDTIPNNTDLYATMCYVLGLVEAPNNGSIENMMMALRVPQALALALNATEPPMQVAVFNEMSTLTITVIVPAALLLIFCVALCCFPASQPRGSLLLSKGYRLLHDGENPARTFPMNGTGTSASTTNKHNSTRQPMSAQDHDALMSMSSEDEL